mmetsp:Transcript_1013/g.3141  ORF Transcript_1013/g.3141 Transcript_1013/m.3141 type:complete len:219 (+) Transcript_1013:317-973(+)
MGHAGERVRMGRGGDPLAGRPRREGLVRRRPVRHRHRHAQPEPGRHGDLLPHGPGVLVELGSEARRRARDALREAQVHPHDLGHGRERQADGLGRGPGLELPHGVQRAGPLGAAPQPRRSLHELRQLRAHLPLRLARPGPGVAGHRERLQGCQPARHPPVALDGGPVRVRQRRQRRPGVHEVAADLQESHEVLHGVDAVLQAVRHEASLRQHELLGRD